MERENAIDVKDLHISYKCLKSFSIKRSLPDEYNLQKSYLQIFL